MRCDGEKRTEKVKRRKAVPSHTLWKSEFMYPFYVDGCESNLLRQFDVSARMSVGRS